MSEIQVELFEEQYDDLAIFTSSSLDQISIKARDSYKELQGQGEADLKFEERYHIQIKINLSQEKFLECYTGLSELEFMCLQFFKKSNQKDNQAESPSSKLSPEQEAIIQKKQNLLKKLMELISMFKKTIKLRQIQLTMVLFILDYHSKLNFAANYHLNFSQVINYMVPIEFCNRPINIFVLEELLKRECEYLIQYMESIYHLKDNYDQYLISDDFDLQTNLQIDNYFKRIKITNSKIKTISEVFSSACVKDFDDLFSVNQIHPRWQWLRKHEAIEYVSLSDKATVQKSFEAIKENLNVINALMSILNERKQNQLSEQFKFQKVKALYETSIKIIKCALFKKQAHFQAQVMIAEPNDKLAKEIWNLPESENFKEFIEMSLPSIQYSEVLYLPRTFREYFNAKFYGKEISHLPQTLINHGTLYGNQLYKKDKYENRIKIRINCSYRISRKYYTNTKQSFEIEKKNSEPNLLTNLTQGMNSFLENMGKMLKKEVPQQIIFHIHGGGFISMSSFIHQTYTRKWAKHLKIPIISVDYGKAPQKPFPSGLYDCLEAYLWTIYHFKQVYEVNPKRIVLVGDSAGGNLVAALTNLLIEWNLPLPAGIVLVYPALNLNISNYTPSLLTALNDMILPHTFLKICAQSYLKDYHNEPSQNHFISPIFACDETLSKYPQTQIFVGNKDPFHDDCCRFTERINQINQKKAHLTILQQFPHGFLQFDLKLMPHEYSRQATKYVQRALQKLIQAKQ